MSLHNRGKGARPSLRELIAPHSFRERARDGSFISSTERPCSQAFFQGMCTCIIGG